MGNYKVLIDDIDSNHDEFVRIHGAADYYGGSEVANICGLGYVSPLEVWLRKTGKKKSDEENEHMRLGRHMEPYLRKRLARELGKVVLPVNQVWQNSDHPWMIMSPDGVTEDAELCEFKNHGFYAAQFWGEDMASDSALCQAHWGLGVSDCKAIYCAAMIGGDVNKFYYPRFERSKEIIEQLMRQVELFRELVKSDIPPGAGAGDSKLIQEYLVNGVDKEKELDLSDSHRLYLRDYQKFDKQRADLKPALDDVERKIRAIKNQFIADSKGCGKIKVGEDLVKVSKVVKKPSTTKGSEYFLVNFKLGDKNGKQ